MDSVKFYPLAMTGT